MRRARVVLLVTILVTVAVVAIGAVALAETATSGRTYEFSVPLDRLVEGDPVAVPVRLPAPDGPPSRVIFVRHDDTVSAYLAIDTRVGCGLLIPSDADYDRLWGGRPAPGAVTYYDNCSGSVYTVDGRCAGGPCRRNLDEYPVDIRGGTARIDVRQRIAGAPAFGTRTLPPDCDFTNPAAEVVGPPILPECR